MMIQSSRDPGRLVHLCPKKLEAFAWRSVVAEIGPSPSAIATILTEMRDESCVHSWKAFAPRDPSAAYDAVQPLVSWERALRPTTFFTYYGIRDDGSQEVIGVGTVSDRIHHGFAYEGFPVIARCYIRKPFRGRGLYYELLNHRTRYCAEHWGDRLCAIHLGSASKEVWKSVTQGAVVEPPFRHVANERLDVGGSFFEIRDFLSFHGSYARALCAPLSTDSCPAGVASNLRSRALLHQISNHLNAMVHGHGFHSIDQLAGLVEAAAEAGWSPRDAHPAMASLLAFGEALTGSCSQS
jgi:GNAT superfamily N-acetyltransferase